MFKIIITGWECEKYVSKCLTSLISQTETNWNTAIVIDPVRDKTYEIAKAFSSDKLSVYLNPQRMYATYNIVFAVKQMNCQDDDVLVWLDLDDWFYTNSSLKIVQRYYERNPNILITHGSWIAFPNNKYPTNNSPYYPEDFKNRNIRKLTLGSWRCSHLKTMKYKVFKNIRECDLKDKNGQWLKSGYDTSFFFPALEMAGYNRVQFIPEILYVYNRETQYNDDKINSAIQDQCTIYNSTLPSYGLL